MSKITRRSYKRKKIIMGAALFGAVGLVSTGFAAWVLSASTSVEQKASLNVGTISDKNMSFEIKFSIGWTFGCYKETTFSNISQSLLSPRYQLEAKIKTNKTKVSGLIV